MDIHRPPFLRSQSDNSSTTTIIPSSYPRFRTLDDFEHVQKGSNTVLGPRRPPRNPARTLVDTKSGFQPVPEARALTGTKEEVTPWELEPFPATFFETPPTAVVPTTSKQTSSVRPSSSSGGHHHSPGISFSDFYLLRRKSTGSHKSSSKAKVKAKMSTTNGHSLLQKQRVTPGPGLPPLPSLHNSSSPNLSSNGNASPRLAHKITSAISPHPYSLATSGTAGHTTTPPALSSSRPLRQPTTSFDQPFVASHPQSHPVASTSTSHTTTAPGSAALPAIGIQKSHSNPNSKSSSKSSIEQHADHQTANHLKFSTADRTILEELRRNISAREAQFVVKGPHTNYGSSDNGYRGGHGGGALGLGIQLGMGGLGVSGGRKHHPYKKEEVPYPRSYDREALDLDVWETLFYHQICESLTWHVFEEPPTRVLDIGCGTGSWLLDCARVWRKCQFVGLDLVPIQPDLQRVGSADLAHRVTWVQENFLEGLPFPNEEFDFVHIKRISLGVPEDKWDFLLEEISRVMKPGAAFEMIEEDLMFPGGTIPSDDEDSGTEDSKSQSVDSAYFSDSETRRYSSSSSYFASGSETRNRNRPRSSSSAGSTSTATDIPKNQNAEKSVRRRSAPLKGHNQRHSTNIDYTALTALMGIHDSENGSTEYERQYESEDSNRGRGYGDSSFDNPSHFRGNLTAGERLSDDFLLTDQLTTGTSSISSSPLLLSSSPSTSTLPASLPQSIPTFMNTSSAIAAPVGRGLKTDAIVEDEEGEESAILESMNDDQASNETDTGVENHMASHFQYPTDSTITPAKIQLSKTDNVSVFSKSIYSPRPLSTSTGSLTDLQSSLNFNPYARLNLVASPGPSTLPPKRPLSSGTHGYGTNSSIHLPSMSFSQSMHSVSSSSPHSPTLVPDVNSESGTISPENKLAHNPASPFLLRTLPKPPVNPRDHSVLEMIYNEMNAARFVNLSPLSLLPNLLGLYFKDLRTHPPVIFTFPPVPVVEHPYLRDPDPDPDIDAQNAIRPSPLPINPTRGRSMSNASNSSSHSSSRLAGSPTPSSARTAYFEGVTDHWINMQQIVKRKSPYIIYDGSRLSALSPSTRASILSATKKSIPSSISSSATSIQPDHSKEEHKAAAYANTYVNSDIDIPRGTHEMFNPRPQKPAHDVRFRLPNTTMNIDLRSLNLHLALRVTEILGCSETMWEWVLEYQEQARNKKRSQETQARARSRSIGSTRPPSHDKQPAPESDNDRLKAVLVELTREEYDDMLRRFYLDMQDCMALPAALDERFGWNIPPAPPPAERKTFEAECEKFQKWEAEQYQRTSFKSLSGQASRLRPNSPVSIVHSSPTLDGLPALYTENLSMNGRSSVSSNFPKTHQGTHSVSSVASTAPSTAPSRRLSRSLRVFVAWKGFGAI